MAGAFMRKILAILLEKWISVPRFLRMGFLIIVVLTFLVFLVGKGFIEVINILNGTSFFTWPTIILSLVIAFIILLFLKFS